MSDKLTPEERDSLLQKLIAEKTAAGLSDTQARAVATAQLRELERKPKAYVVNSAIAPEGEPPPATAEQITAQLERHLRDISAAENRIRDLSDRAVTAAVAAEEALQKVSDSVANCAGHVANAKNAVGFAVEAQEKANTAAAATTGRAAASAEAAEQAANRAEAAAKAATEAAASAIAVAAAPKPKK